MRRALLLTLPLLLAAPALAQTTAEPLGPGGRDPDENELFPAFGNNDRLRVEVAPLSDATPAQRQAFAAALSGYANVGTAPFLMIFTSGPTARRLVMVAAEAGGYDTEQRCRALLAYLFARLRRDTAFAALAVTDEGSFYQYAKLLGFQKVTVSDGRTYSLQVRLD